MTGKTAQGTGDGRRLQTSQHEKAGQDAHGRTRAMDLPLPMGPSFMVPRTDLMREVVRAARQAGIVVFCAPKGFGKTALLLQFSDEVRHDPARGSSRIVNADGALIEELLVQLDGVEEELSGSIRPAIAIDNVPAYEGADAERLVERIHALRDHDYEIALACTPLARRFVDLLGDSVKFGAKQLLVRPREYAEWTRVFSISSRLDVYQLTQGVPALVAALQSSLETTDDTSKQLEGCVHTLYWSILAELERVDEKAYRLAAMLILVGNGSLRDFERAGLTVDIECLRRLMHDYPVFGYDAASGCFSCLGMNDGARMNIRGYLAGRAAQLVRRAVRVQMKAGRTDEALDLSVRFLTPQDTLHIIKKAPLQVILAGYASLVRDVVDGLRDELEADEADASIKLAVYAGAVTMGDYRMARALAGELALHLADVANHVDAADWQVARALGAVWETCRGIVLPEAPCQLEGAPAIEAKALELHRECVQGLLEQGAWTRAVGRFLERRGAALRAGTRISVPWILLQCDDMLAEVLTGTFVRPDERDMELARLEHVLRDRGLTPILCYARMVRSVRRLFAGTVITDEQAIIDANTIAVRTSDLAMQLFCSIMEGWQDLSNNQSGSARFRGQQALKLAGERYGYLAGAALFLERVANIRGISRFAVREEAGMLDLTPGEIGVEQAWVTALYLSAARCEPELSAWYSLYRDVLLTPSFRLFARLAMSLLGEQADAMRRLIPHEMLSSYLMDNEEAPTARQLFQVVGPSREEEHAGQIVFRLLGGFSIERNGHVLTSSEWRRKKAGVLAARLVLAQGGMVGRQVLWEEFWPGITYARARENLYATISVLRRAFGQRGKTGPQYLMIHEDSIAINREYVTSDVYAFEQLARQVLIGQLRLSARKVVELCLRIEQLYAGPLYVPEQVAPQFFIRMRRILQSKFIDCMIRGVDAALEEEDTASALWMAEAGLRQDPLREDLLRSALHVYDVLGRRKDVVDLYESYLKYLKAHAKGEPERETKQLYRDIVEQHRMRSML